MNKLVRDVGSETELKGLKLRTPKGVVGYYFSRFSGGVLFNAVPGENAVERLFPQVAAKIKDVLNWEIVGDGVRVNCDSLTSLKYTVNE